MICKEEYHRFNCHKYKILTDIVYGYNSNDELIFTQCSLKDKKHCDGYESPNRKCPLAFPHLLKDEL